MPTLLNIQTSPNGDESVSRLLSRNFITSWQQKYPDGTILDRDLMQTELPFVTRDWYLGAGIPAHERTPAMRDALKISDALNAELKSADHILIGAAMHNLSVPANLKTYLDQVVRRGETQSGPPDRVGLVTGKKCRIIVASGGVYDAGTPAASSDFESGYLRRILAFIGITDVEIIMAGGSVNVYFGKMTMEEHLSHFNDAIAEAVGSLTCLIAVPSVHSDDVLL